MGTPSTSTRLSEVASKSTTCATGHLAIDQYAFLIVWATSSLWGRGLVTGGQRHRLQLQEALQALHVTLVTDAGFLAAAEWATAAGGGAAVHRTGSGDDPRRDLDAVPGLGGEHRPAKAVHAVIGDRDGLVLIGVGDDRQHRAEDLLLGNLHLGVDVDENRRLDVPPLGLVRRTAAPEEELGGLGQT